MPRPEIFTPNDFWERNWGLDPAKYLVNPGYVISPGNVSAGELAHVRPYLSNGYSIFVFPVGTEGFRAAGDAQLGLHHYIGDNAVDGVTIHYEEGRITLEGTFPGLTAQDNMVMCRNILRSPAKDPGLTLYAPGVFEREQYVLAENWEFTHDRDDRTHSIEYTITFVRTGDKHKVRDVPGRPAPPNPARKSVPRGKPHRVFTIKSGVRTLRGVSKVVYKSPAHWKRLVILNQGQLNNWKRKHPALPPHRIPLYRWPIGTKFRY
jgi:hypothetical protein